MTEDRLKLQWLVPILQLNEYTMMSVMTQLYKPDRNTYTRKSGLDNINQSSIIFIFKQIIHRDSQVRSTRRPIPEGLEGYEIANHFL